MISKKLDEKLKNKACGYVFCNVGDATIKGSETGTSFKQELKDYNVDEGE